MDIFLDQVHIKLAVLSTSQFHNLVWKKLFIADEISQMFMRLSICIERDIAMIILSIIVSTFAVYCNAIIIICKLKPSNKRFCFFFPKSTKLRFMTSVIIFILLACIFIVQSKVNKH